MKRILSYMTIAAVLTACSEMYGPEQVSTAVVNSEGIEITGIAVTDNSLTFTLTPKGEAAYYSYLVDQADAPQALDSSTIYSLGYDGAVAEGIIKWTSEKTSSTVTIDELEPNTTYQIYAVAGSPTGVPSSVAVANARTSDGVNPSHASFSSKGNVVTISFSEGVTRGEGAVTIAYYATNTAEFYSDPQPVGTLTAAAEDIVSDGSSTVTVTVNGVPAGALYTVSLAAGAFKDSAGNSSKALESGVTITEEGPAPKNIYGQIPAVAFEIAPVEDDVFTDPSLPITTTIDSEYELSGYGKGTASVVFQNAVKTTEIALTAGSDFGLMSTDGTIAVILPENPERGDDVILTIGEGAFLDIYGNGNAEWTATLKYSYGYTMEDIVGEYVALGESAVDGNTYYLTEGADSFVTITEDDSEEGCNVAISGIYSNDAKIYGHFDFDSGILSIPDFQYLTDVYLQGVAFELYFANYSDEVPVNMTVVQSGMIQSSEPWMLYLPDAGGYLDVYSATQMTRQDQTSQTGQLKAQEAARHDSKIKGTVAR